MSAIPAPSRPSKSSFLDLFLLRSCVRDRNDIAVVWRVLVVAVSLASNAAVLICQQVAIRLLAPLIGSSIETWSAILGVFLLGIAIGSLIAGKFSDRCSATSMIAISLLLGAVSVYLMPHIVAVLAASPTFVRYPLEMQIAVASISVCLLPGITLSLVTAPSIRSLVTSATEAGSVSGRIFAWGTFGSLLGNYLTGFVLLAMFGISAIVQATWIALLALAGLVFVIGRRATISSAAGTVGLLDRKQTTSGIVSASAKDPEFEARVAADIDAWNRRALVIVITCSFVSGALEGAAFRILAPLVGVSMFLTAGVVGVVLTGMATGNAIGGNIAERVGTIAALRKSLVFAAISTLAIVILWTIALNFGIYDGLSMIPKVIAWSFTLFLLPALALGTITPQVIGLSVRDVNRTGSIAGTLYGYSTLGCILGILVSAWWMIESFGAIRTSVICGALPLLLILLLSRFESASSARESKRRAASLLVFSGCLFLFHHSPFDRESKYFALKVTDVETEDRHLKKLALDSLVHSCVDLSDPTFLFYPHEQVQAELTRSAAEQARRAGRVPRILVIGGGGYTFPRWVEAQADLADVSIEVVEIDPAVTAIAKEKLGLSPTTRVVSIHMDGRQFIKSAQLESYDLVIQDAVNDMSVPYHLMTAEYTQLVKRLLHRDCLYLLTVIDNFESGQFLASAVRTTATVFGDANLILSQKPVSNVRNVFVIAGRNADKRSQQGELHSNTDPQSGKPLMYVFPQSEVTRLLTRCASSSPLLTDDYAPVDVLMSGQFLQRERPE